MDPIQPLPNTTTSDSSELPPLNVAMNQEVATIDPEVAYNRAMKVKIGIPDLPSSHEEITQNILTGKEDQVRKEAASSLDLRDNINRQKSLISMAESSSKPLTSQEYSALDAALEKKQRDPSTVIETEYAKAFVESIKSAAQALPDSPVNDALQQDPEYVAKQINKGSVLAGMHQVANTFYEKAEAAHNERGTAKTLFDFSKYLLTGYNEYNLRDFKKYGGGLGDNMDSQVSAMYGLGSVEKFNVKAQSIYDSLTTGVLGGNPDLALTFFSALKGQSNLERMSNNMFTGLDVNFLAGSPLRAYTRSLVRAQRLTENAVKDVAKDIAKPGVITKAAVADAAGDLKEAGIQKSIDNVTKVIKGTSSGPESSLSNIQSIFNASIDATNANPGSLSREVASRIAERSATLRDNLLDRIQKSMYVDRLPEWFSIEKNTRDLTDHLKTDYRGANESLLDIKFRFDPIDKALYADHYIAKTTGELFGSERTAENVIKDMKIGSRELTGEKAGNVFTTKLTGADIKPVMLDTGKRYPKIPLERIEGSVHPYNKYEFTVNGTKGEMVVRNEGKNIHIEDIGLHGVSPEEYSLGQGSFGHSAMRSILRSLQAEYPNAKTISGQRVSGARILNPTAATKATAEVEVNLPKAVVEQKGVGFYIKWSRPINEEWSVIRDGLMETGETQTPKSWKSALMEAVVGRSIRSTEDLLSIAQSGNRKALVYPKSDFFKLVNEDARTVREIKTGTTFNSNRKLKLQQWNRAMDEAANTPDPTTGKPGFMFNSPGDVDLLYQKVNGRFPDEQEMRAAFAYKNTQMTRNILENLEIRTAKLRTGAQTHTISVLNVAREKEKFTPLREIKVDGTKMMTKPPANGETIVFLADKSTGSRAYTTNMLTGKLGDTLEQKIKDGTWTLIEMSNPEERPLYGLTQRHPDIRPRYVVATKVVSKPLDWDQLKQVRRPDFDYDHNVVQSIVSRDPISKFNHFEGDRYIMGHNIGALSRDVASKLDQIRIHLKADDIDAAKAFHSTSGLPQDFNDIHDWFKPNVTPEGLPIPSRLSKEEKIISVPYNRMSIDMDKTLETKYGDSLVNSFKDNYIKGLLADRRDPHSYFTLDNRGTASTPLYSMSPVKYIDPITTVSRGLSKAINGRFINDYKIFSIEHWIQEAKEHLAIPDNSLKSSPQYFFHNPIWNSGVDPIIKSNLETARLAIKQTLGIEDKQSTWLHKAVQTLSDSLYDNVNARVNLVPMSMLPAIRDPISFVRSAVFHPVVGLFSPAQIVVQTSAFTNIFGVAGVKYAAPGTKASILYGWSRLSKDPAILDKLDQIATQRIIPGTSRYMRGEFREFVDLMDQTGFANVGNEYTAIDRAMHHDLIGSKYGDILNAGTLPFRLGETAVRVGAFATAHREFRDLNPTGAIGRDEIRRITQRADLLYTNMSSASTSNLNKGLMSIPLQFQTYPLRLAEQVLGKRLTSTEKMRLFGTYAIMFGIPTALNLPGIPFGEIAKQEIAKSDYVTGSPQNSFLNTLTTEGGLAMLLHQFTGAWHGTGERYGGQGVEPDLLKDKAFWVIALGAPGSIISKAAQGMHGFVASMVSLANDGGTSHPLKASDFIDPFKAVSIVDKGTQLAFALNYGKWLSRQEAYLTDVDKSNAILMFLSGLNPKSTSDSFTIQSVIDSEKKAQSAAEKIFIKEIQRGRLEGQNGDSDAEHASYIRAFATLKGANYPVEEIPKALTIASEGFISSEQRLAEEFAFKNVPEDRKVAARAAYLQKLRLKEKAQ